MNIGFICYQVHNKGINGVANHEDEELIQFLQSKGYTTSKLVWHDQSVNWQDFDLLILKSPWDYHEDISRFHTWLDTIDSLGVRLLNPTDIVRKNSNKRYLAEISAAGLPTIKTSYLTQGEAFKADTSLFDELQSDKIVIKPCVSAGAHNTFVVTKADINHKLEDINQLLRDADYMAQPFIKEITEQGEWSFIFFNSVFSHAVLKRPKTGDFRVQHIHGGTVEHHEVNEVIISNIQCYVDEFAHGSLYTRVDGIFIAHEFQLMELEMIEPYLFLNNDQERMERYHQALKQLTNH